MSFASTTVWSRSSSATPSITRKAVPQIWSIGGPQIPPWKYGAGKVAKMENVASVWPFVFGPLATLSKVLIASW